MTRYRIGIDVGGTNTDAVLLNPLTQTILSTHKTRTTPNPGAGIATALTALLTSSNVPPSAISGVTIGTTHFINAVVERNVSLLARIGVLRLAGPFGKHVPPGTDWPRDLRDAVLGWWGSVSGGVEVDGRVIRDINEEEVVSACDGMKNLGINVIVVIGIFSPSDTTHNQEHHAARIIHRHIPHATTILSRDIANLGFLERENASMLNATMLPHARTTLSSFSRHVRRLDITCPIFISQNDGTMVSARVAARTPVRALACGPTNSMRGAAFLSGLRGPAVVVDVGGTTTDVGVLEPGGFPRVRGGYGVVAGVRVNFPGPDVGSVAVGGGSVVDQDGGRVGPGSVGYRLDEEGVVFGGDVLTATDFAVFGDPGLGIGDRTLLRGRITQEAHGKFKETVARHLEALTDAKKTSPAAIPMILVGGGVPIAPSTLAGASEVIIPEHANVANAVGAAVAKISAVVDTVREVTGRSEKAVLEEVCAEAKLLAVENGAVEGGVEVIEMEAIPLLYVAGKTRFVVRAAGEFDFTREGEAIDDIPADDTTQAQSQPSQTPPIHPEPLPIDLKTYRPKVLSGAWHISPTDLHLISLGTSILGCGGGGSPYSQTLTLAPLLSPPHPPLLVIPPSSLPDSAQVATGGGAGSPTVAIEKLSADELLQSQDILYKYLRTRPTHAMAVEIGGANGLVGLLLGARLGVPVVDGDWMGRAYPTKQQTTPCVFSEKSPVWMPVAMCDGNGAEVVMTSARSDADVERILRGAVAGMGAQVGFADAPTRGGDLKRWVVGGSLSLAWRIGRVVEGGRVEGVEGVGERVVKEVGGRVLGRGKIVEVWRELRGGHSYGECVVDTGEGMLRVPFKNENIAVIRQYPSRTTDEATRNKPADNESIRTESEQKESRNNDPAQNDILAIVPDLISLLDAQNGQGLGTPDYRYGLHVVVLGIPAHPAWTGSQRALEIGGPAAFGMRGVEWRGVGGEDGGWGRGVVEEFGT